MQKQTLVFFDRDGTLIYDDKYYLGSQRNWRGLIKFLPGVLRCVRKLKKKNVRAFMITNQPGVAVNELPLLTLEKAHRVCREVLARMRSRGADLDGYFVCPHASPSYVRAHPQFTFSQPLVCNCPCMKPRHGMIDDAMRKYNLRKNNTRIFVVGDRASDVLAGIRAGGYGILVPFKNEPKEIDKFKKIKSRRKFLAKNFCGAVDFIISKIK